MSNTKDIEVSKIVSEGDNLEEDTSTFFSSRIHIENPPHEEDDNEIDSILNKGDGDYIPKTELDNNIDKLIEKWQSLEFQENLMAEKAKNIAEEHSEVRKLGIKEKKDSTKIENLTYQREIQKFRNFPLAPQKKTKKSDEGIPRFKVPDSKLASLTLDVKNRNNICSLPSQSHIAIESYMCTKNWRIRSTN